VAAVVGVAWPAERYAAPAGATLLKNTVGTAPGVWWPLDDRVILLLPGPPRELQPMFESAVTPLLIARTGGRAVHRRVIKIAGRRESEVEAVAQPIYGPLAFELVPIETTILASPGQVELHLSARGAETPAIGDALDRGVRALAAALGPAVFSVDGRALEDVVGARLRARGWRIGLAESCTGGLVGARITDVAGSSAWFVGGVVAYANEVKTAVLGVPAGLIATHGAVSEPVAAAMADGACRALGAEVGVAVTGIAGPTGGTPEKPIGTVVIAVATPAGASVRTWKLRGDRATVRQSAAALALDAVRLAIGSDEPA
jgi:nicotinamide-nucleotide amidase